MLAASPREFGFPSKVVGMPPLRSATRIHVSGHLAPWLVVMLEGVCGPLGEAADPARYGSAPACVKTMIGELFHQIFQSGEYFPHLSERFSQECRSGESPDRRGAWRA